MAHGDLWLGRDVGQRLVEVARGQRQNVVQRLGGLVTRHSYLDLVTIADSEGGDHRKTARVNRSRVGAAVADPRVGVMSAHFMHQSCRRSRMEPVRTGDDEAVTALIGFAWLCGPAPGPLPGE